MSFSRDVMMGMLRKGQTGNEILQILDVIAPSTEGDNNTEPMMTDYNGNPVADF